MIDIIETVYRGASKGRGLVVSPKGASYSSFLCITPQLLCRLFYPLQVLKDRWSSLPAVLVIFSCFLLSWCSLHNGIHGCKRKIKFDAYFWPIYSVNEPDLRKFFLHLETKAMQLQMQVMSTNTLLVSNQMNPNINTQTTLANGCGRRFHNLWIRLMKL